MERIPDDEVRSLDLNCWKVAFNGAEPVKAHILKAFSDKFAASGFSPRAHYPCYGMAEATLFLKGGRVGEGATTLQADLPVPGVNATAELNLNSNLSPLVACGEMLERDSDIRIVDPTTLEQLADGHTGEIWARSGSVAKGYWSNADLTRETFQAYLANGLEGPFLRTGDLGFSLAGRLYISGRLKEVMIFNGVNYYPVDLEDTSRACHGLGGPNSTAAFSMMVEGQEELIIVQELQRRELGKTDYESLCDKIRKAVMLHHQLSAYAVILCRAGAIPRTTSGKLQRRRCRELYVSGQLSPVFESLRHRTGLFGEAEKGAVLCAPEFLKLPPSRQRETLTDEVIEAARAVLCLSDATALTGADSLICLGLDSIGGARVKHRLERRLGVTLSSESILLENPRIEDIVERLLAELLAKGSSQSAYSIPPEDGHPSDQPQHNRVLEETDVEVLEW